VRRDARGWDELGGALDCSISSGGKPVKVDGWRASYEHGWSSIDFSGAKPARHGPCSSLGFARSRIG